MLKLLLALALLILGMRGVGAQSDNPLLNGEIYPIIGYTGGPPQPHLNTDQYKQMKAAGFTVAITGVHSMDLVDNRTRWIYLWNDKPQEPQFVQDAGLLAMVGLFYQMDPADPESRKHIDENLAVGKQYPNVVGYYVVDEPTAGEFAQYARVVAYLREHAPARVLLLINLYPNNANPETQLQAPSYEEYVDQYMRLFRPQVLSYDNYPCRGADGWGGGYYANLEIIRRASLKYDTPFWAFIQAVPMGEGRWPTKADQCLMAFSNLAYGARGMYYFYYEGGIVDDQTYQPNPQYYRIRRLNAYIASWGRYLREAEAVCHVGEIPAGARALDPTDPQSAALSCTPDNAIVSTLKTAAGQRALMIVNKDFQQPHTFALRLRSTVRAVRPVSPRLQVPDPTRHDEVVVGPEQPVCDGLTVTLQPGFAAVYELVE